MDDPTPAESIAQAKEASLMFRGSRVDSPRGGGGDRRSRQRHPGRVGEVDPAMGCRDHRRGNAIDKRYSALASTMLKRLRRGGSSGRAGRRMSLPPNARRRDWVCHRSDMMRGLLAEVHAQLARHGARLARSMAGACRSFRAYQHAVPVVDTLRAARES
jgi:hypothetical protein